MQRLGDVVLVRPDSFAKAAKRGAACAHIHGGVAHEVRALVLHDLAYLLLVHAVAPCGVASSPASLCGLSGAGSSAKRPPATTRYMCSSAVRPHRTGTG